MEAHSGSLERCVRAMAILLIMAGDVEQNPGPLPPASSSPESRALYYHSVSLITAIADPLRLSWKLFSAGLIENATKDKANLQTMTIEEKNDVLLSAVMRRVDTDPSFFHQYVDLLKDDEDDILKILGGKLEDTCNEFTKGDSDQSMLNLPAKQPEQSPKHIRVQPSQPHSPLTLSCSILDSYNVHEFQIHPPHSQPYALHSHPSQPHPQLSQPHFQPSHYPHSLQLHHQTSQLYSPAQPSIISPHSFCPCPCLCFHPSQPPPHTLPLPHHVSDLSTTQPVPPQPTIQMGYSSSQTARQLEHLPPQPIAHSPPQSPFFLFVSYLRSFYNSEVPISYCKFPLIPKKKFINLAAISREKVSSKELKQFMLATLHGNVDQIIKTKTPIKIEAILEKNPEEMLHCVLVEGAPGVGKTTLSWEICKRWGRGELFQQYTVAILLRLRDQSVQNAKSIINLIFFGDEDDEVCKRKISQYIKQTKGKDMLLILEGLDELPKHLLYADRSSIFTRLLSRELLPDATLLVTSRPSATVQLQKRWEISRHIEVLGFTEEDITKYIQSTLSPQEFSAFDSYLSTYPNVKLTMYIPLNCAIIVEVYRSCQQSSHPPPTTTTELYTRLVQTILLRYLDSHPQYKNDANDIDKFTELPSPVFNHFCSLIEMAYDGVQSQQLIFHDQHNVIEHLGFMDTVTELFSTRHSISYSYNFLHLSVQEYLAAYFISVKSIDMQQELLQAMCTQQHLRNMGKFLAGITSFKGMDKATIKAIIEKECKKDDYDGSLQLSPYTLQLLHESKDYSIISGHPSYSCRLTDYSALLDFYVLGHCIANSSYKWRLELGESGQYMQSTERVDMLVQTLTGHSSTSYTIERIHCSYDAPECVQHLLLELPQYALQQIQELELLSNNENPQPLPQCVLEHILLKMNGLHSLGLHDGAISSSGAIAIADIIKNNNTLRTMAFIGNNINDEGIKLLNEAKEDLVLGIYQ